MKRIIGLLLIVLLAILVIEKYNIWSTYKREEIIINNIKKEDNIWPTLKAINKDIIGWLRIDNTPIDYPVVKGSDNKEYLHTSFDKKHSLSGTIFMDYRNNSLLEDNINIIYGHNMNDNQMFSTLTKYINKDYFYTHLDGMFITMYNTYKLEVISVLNTNAYNKSIYNINSNIDNYLDNIKNNSIYYNDITPTKLLILSTCNNINNQERVVIIANISPNE